MLILETWKDSPFSKPYNEDRRDSYLKILGFNGEITHLLSEEAP